jgi:hypothetical protein
VNVRHRSSRVGLSGVRSPAPVLLVLGMTASQVASYAFPFELPPSAQRPDVQVRYDLDELDYAPELCGVCETSVGGPVGDSVMAVSYRFRLDTEPSRTGCCTAEHAEKELEDVLENLCQTPAEVVLHLPPVLPSDRSGQVETPLGPVVFPDEDPSVQELLSLREGIARMRSDSSDPFETLGFEVAREKALAYVQAAVNDRIERLGRAA